MRSVGTAAKVRHPVGSADAKSLTSRPCSPFLSLPFSFPLLSDNGGKVSAEYGTALKIPFMGTFSNRQTYIIDPNGNLKWVFTDVQSRLAKHADEVVEKLKELTKA